MAFLVPLAMTREGLFASDKLSLVVGKCRYCFFSEPCNHLGTGAGVGDPVGIAEVRSRQRGITSAAVEVHRVVGPDFPVGAGDGRNVDALSRAR